MQPKLYIGIGHKARQGKDHSGRFIARCFPGEVRVMAFADALKDYCRVHHKMVGKDAPLLQRVGVEFREKQSPDFWVRILEEKAKDVSEPIIAITDCRFPNEAAFVRDRGGILVKVSRLLHDGSPFVADDRPADHPSETALDVWCAWNYEIQAKSVVEIEEMLMASVVPAIRVRLATARAA